MDLNAVYSADGRIDSGNGNFYDSFASGGQGGGGGGPLPGGMGGDPFAGMMMPAQQGGGGGNNMSGPSLDPRGDIGAGGGGGGGGVMGAGGFMDRGQMFQMEEPRGRHQQHSMMGYPGGGGGMGMGGGMMPPQQGQMMMPGQQGGAMMGGGGMGQPNGMMVIQQMFDSVLQGNSVTVSHQLRTTTFSLRELYGAQYVVVESGGANGMRREFWLDPMADKSAFVQHALFALLPGAGLRSVQVSPMQALNGHQVQFGNGANPMMDGGEMDLLERAMRYVNTSPESKRQQELPQMIEQQAQEEYERQRQHEMAAAHGGGHHDSGAVTNTTTTDDSFFDKHKGVIYAILVVVVILVVAAVGYYWFFMRKNGGVALAAPQRYIAQSQGQYRQYSQGNHTLQPASVEFCPNPLSSTSSGTMPHYTVAY